MMAMEKMRGRKTKFQDDRRRSGSPAPQYSGVPGMKCLHWLGGAIGSFI
jgi:hypothetical protein